MPVIKFIKSYQSGSLLNRLETVDKAQGKAYQVYDQTMMNEDLGYYQSQQHQPTTLFLKEDNKASYVYQKSSRREYDEWRVFSYWLRSFGCAFTL